MRRLIPWAENRAKTRKQRSKVQEKEVASALGGRVRPNSGATLYAKGDVLTPLFLVEAKTTERKSFSLTQDLLKKIESEAFAEGKDPLMIVRFEKMEDIPQDWAVLPLRVLRSLLQS